MNFFIRFGAASLLLLLTLSPALAAGPPKPKDDKRVQVLLQEAETAWSQNNFEAAAQDYRLALKLRPDLAEAHYGLGLALARLERYPEAVSAIKQALHHQPGLSKAWKDLGVIYLKLRNWPEAEKAFKAALERNPQDPEACYDLGVVAGKEGKHQEARESFEKALRLKPDYVQALTNLGMANIKLNRWAEAKSSFDKALSLKADSGEAYLGLLACYIQQGDSQKAAETYQTLSKLDKNMARKADELLGR